MQVDQEMLETFDKLALETIKAALTMYSADTAKQTDLLACMRASIAFSYRLLIERMQHEGIILPKVQSNADTNTSPVDQSS